jgi:tetratricopeptide (TPR) repeat protein
MGGLAAGVRVADAASYYQALSLQKLGEPEKAKAIFQHLLASETKSSAGSAAPDATTNSGASLTQRMQAADSHFLAGLGYLGLNDTAAAKQQFQVALASCPDHLAAKVALTEIQSP